MKKENTLEGTPYRGMFDPTNGVSVLNFRGAGNIQIKAEDASPELLTKAKAFFSQLAMEVGCMTEDEKTDLTSIEKEVNDTVQSVLDAKAEPAEKE